jgi:general secretion pathway protein I
MSRAAPPRRGQGGYTLIEVVVAFALLAFAMALLLGAMTNATRQVRAAGEYGRAALHAQSLLDQTGIGEALQPGRRDGRLENGRYRWEMDVRPWRDPAAPPATAPILGAPQMMELELILHWGEGGPRQTLRVQTLRLITPNDPNAAGVVP